MHTLIKFDVQWLTTNTGPVLINLAHISSIALDDKSKKIRITLSNNIYIDLNRNVDYATLLKFLAFIPINTHAESYVSIRTYQQR